MSFNNQIQKDNIRKLLLGGIGLGATHCIIVCDYWDYEDLPIFVMPDQDVRSIVERYSTFNEINTENFMEVYNLNMDIESQLNEFRAMNF